MHVQTKEALQNKNTQSITWWNTSTNQVANSHDDAMHMNMYMTLLHSHTHKHIHKPIYAWTTNKKAYSIQFFPLDFSGRLGKKGWKPNRDLRRWVIVNINRTRHVFVYSFDRTRSVCIGLLNTATNAPWSLDMQIRLPLELMNFQCNLRILIREWRLLFKSMNRFI